MARNQLGILQQVWAGETGATQRVPIPDFEAGYDNSYTGNKFPDRRNLNDVLCRATAGVADVNKFGAALPWDLNIQYSKYATVFGTDGVLYVSQSDANYQNDPTNSGSYPTYWISLAEVLGITAIKDDREYIRITGHSTNNITQSTVGEWTYSKSGFQGSGLNHDEIRTLHVFCKAGRHEFHVQASYPDGTIHSIFNLGLSGSLNDASQAIQVCDIPVNKATTSVTIKIVTATAAVKEMTIIGATQRTK